MNSRYRPERPDPNLYLPEKGLTSAERAAEQDSAAGGHEARIMKREDGSTVLGSVALRCYSDSRRVYAYLRWSSGSGRTSERYLGDVSENVDRATALRDACSRARALRSVTILANPT